MRPVSRNEAEVAWALSEKQDDNEEETDRAPPQYEESLLAV